MIDDEFDYEVVMDKLDLTKFDKVLEKLHTSDSNKSLESVDSDDVTLEMIQSQAEETTVKSNEPQMLRRMFHLPVEQVIKTERCKHLMIYLRNFSANLIQNRSEHPDISHIDNDYCVKFFRSYIIMLTNSHQKIIDNISDRQFVNFIRFTMSLWNLSDKYESLCVRMTAFEVHIHLIRLLGKLYILSPLLQSRAIYTMFLSIVGILHNIINKLHYTRAQYRAENLIEYLIPFSELEPSNQFIGLKTAALLLLAFLVNENENSSLNSKDNHIIYILDILKMGLESPEHYSKYYGYHCLEILQGLRHIASPDRNKTSLINNGVLKLLENILRTDNDRSDQEEVVAGLELLWSLSFSKECLQAFDNEACNLRSRIKDLSEGNDQAIVLSTKGILWNIETQRNMNIKRLIIKDAESPNVNGHIMISYNHRNQDVMVRIKDALVSNGYQVWMDVDNMRACFVDAMAEGIQQASVLILGLCQVFKDSPHCRQEVKYAYTLGIPFVPVLLENGFIADGWLGLMCATLIYTEFHDVSKFDSSLIQLQTQLGPLGKVRKEVLISEGNSDIRNPLITGIECNIQQSDEAVVSSHCVNGNKKLSVTSVSNCLTSCHVSSRPARSDNPIEITNYSTIDSFISAAPKRDRHKVLDWSLTQCQAWFIENRIDPETYGSPLNLIDGPLLFELAEMRIAAPQAYLVAAKNELNLNFIDNLRLSQALRLLDNEH